MPVPGTKEIRRPLLDALKGGSPQNFRINEITKAIAEHFGLNIDAMSPHDRNALKERIDEAKAYLTTRHLISNPSRQDYMITQKGQEALEGTTGIIDDEENPVSTQPQEAADDIDTLPAEIPDEQQEPEGVPDVEALPDAMELPQEAAPEDEEQAQELDTLSDTEEIPDEEEHSQDSAEAEPETLPDDEITPSDTHTQDYIEEVDPMPIDELTEDYSEAIQPLNIEDVLERHNSELADKILMRTASLPPDVFSTFVADLLSKMGYNVFQNARYTSDLSGKTLIQGVILDPNAQTPIYIHAEKLSPGRTVGKSDMRDFADELAEMGGSGIFATTGDFSEQAEVCAQDERIMLIDGHKLAGLMISHNFCVNVEKVFEVKELDEESFSDYES